jgi:hypothetical protein
MILPNKYITIEKSIIGVGAFMLKKLYIKKPILITDFWVEVYKDKLTTSYKYFVSVLVYLYTIKAIDLINGYLICLKN